MTDQELLEKAAKAIGLNYHAYVDHPLMGKGINIGDCDSDLWNPLDDDGQALRLAVQLHICIYTDGDSYICGVTERKTGVDAENETGWVECRADDGFAATRRAIVRAAASLAG